MPDNEQHDRAPATSEPDASKRDALDDLLSARDAGVIALFDILRSEGKSVDQAVSKLVGDGVLPLVGAERFAFEHKDRPVRKKRKDGPGGAGNGKAGAELGGGQAASFTAAEAERLTTWFIEIAADLGYEGQEHRHPHRPWFTLATTGSGAVPAMTLTTVHVHGDAEVGSPCAGWLGKLTRMKACSSGR
jgi:hypothetical protein